MKKAFVPRAFLFFTLLFVLLAACSFVAFRETEQTCSAIGTACKAAKQANQDDMLWEVVARRILSLVTI